MAKKDDEFYDSDFNVGAGAFLGNAASGAAAGAATGSAFGPWGAAVGGIAGGALGLAQTKSQQNLAYDAWAQQQDLMKDLELRADYETQMQQNALSTGMQRQIAAQQAQQAAARGGLSPEFAAQLEGQALRDSELNYLLSRPGDMNAAKQAELAERAQVLREYDLGQSLANDFAQAQGTTNELARALSSGINTVATIRGDKGWTPPWPTGPGGVTTDAVEGQTQPGPGWGLIDELGNVLPFSKYQENPGGIPVTAQGVQLADGTYMYPSQLAGGAVPAPVVAPTAAPTAAPAPVVASENAPQPAGTTAPVQAQAQPAPAQGPARMEYRSGPLYTPGGAIIEDSEKPTGPRIVPVDDAVSGSGFIVVGTDNPAKEFTDPFSAIPKDRPMTETEMNQIVSDYGLPPEVLKAYNAMMYEADIGTPEYTQAVNVIVGYSKIGPDPNMDDYSSQFPK